MHISLKASLCILTLGYFSGVFADAATVAQQLIKQQELCLKDIRPVSFQGAFMQQVAQFLNNVCLSNPKVTIQEGGKQALLTAQAQEAGLSGSVPVTLVLSTGK